MWKVNDLIGSQAEAHQGPHCFKDQCQRIYLSIKVKEVLKHIPVLHQIYLASIGLCEMSIDFNN